MKKGLKKLKKEVKMPIWALLLFIGIAIMGLGALIATMISSDKETAIQNHEEKEMISKMSTAEVADAAIREAFYRSGKMSPLLIIILVIGISVGLSRGIALVRVEN